MKSTPLQLLILLSLIHFSCSKEIALKNGNLVLTIDGRMRCTVSSQGAGAGSMTEASSATEFLETKKFTADDFILGMTSSSSLADSTGTGKIWTIRGNYIDQGIALTKVLQIKLYDNFPGL